MHNDESHYFVGNHTCSEKFSDCLVCLSEVSLREGQPELEERGIDLCTPDLSSILYFAVNKGICEYLEMPAHLSAPNLQMRICPHLRVPGLPSVSP